MLFTKEPVAITAAISVAIKAIIVAAMAFGLKWSAEQLAAVMFAVDALLALYAILVVRNQVVATSDVNALIRTAVKQPDDTTVAEVKEIQAAKDAA